MITSIQTLLALALGLAALVNAQDPKIVGTWTTKSKKVVTGPVSVPPPPLLQPLVVHIDG